MNRALNRCPICEKPLTVSRLTCDQCRVTIDGSFERCRFCRLAPDHLEVIERFLRFEGNLSRLSEDLGVSFPTARNRLTAALGALGLTANGESHRANGEERAATRRDLLDALARGELSATAAAEALRELE